MDYNFQPELIKKFIHEYKVKRVLIQLADGLKQYHQYFSKLLREYDVKPYFSGSHTWGGCDIAIDEARKIGVSTIIHVGHHGPVRVNIPPNMHVLFIPAYSNIDIKPCVLNAIDKIRGYRNIGLFSSIQHIHQFNIIKGLLEKNGFKVYSSQSNDREMIYGQIIGCNLSAAIKVRDKVDLYISIAGGYFHGIGLALATGKRVLNIDPYTCKSFFLDKFLKKIIAQRLFYISKAIEAKSFGIIVSLKQGQFRINIAEKIKRKLLEINRNAEIIVFDEINPELLLNFDKFDVYINTACPRIAIDDVERFMKPVLNIGEVKYIFRGSIEDYSTIDAISY